MYSFILEDLDSVLAWMHEHSYITQVAILKDGSDYVLSVPEEVMGHVN